jgi:hypothetical protein
LRYKFFLKKTIMQAPHIISISFSQSGQTRQVEEAVLEPLIESGVTVSQIPLVQQHPYPFPWPLSTLLNAIPETILLRPSPNKPITPPAAEATIVILFWQVWYLSPSCPVTAFLQSPQAKAIINGKIVVSVVVCRDMWYSAFDTLAGLVEAAGGRLVDHAAVTSSAGWTSLSTPYWLFTGKRKMLTFIPPAGLTDNDISGCRRFGEAIRTALTDPERLVPTLLFEGLNAAPVNTILAPVERITHRIIHSWAKPIIKLGPPQSLVRKVALFGSFIFLYVLIVAVAPLVIAINLVRTWLSPEYTENLKKRGYMGTNSV